MKTKLWAVALVVLCTLFTAFGQFFYKLGAHAPMSSFYAIVTNYAIIAGLALYGVASVLLVISLKHGELSLLYPFISLSFIWVLLISVIFFSETLQLIHWSGILIIMMGISLIGYGKEHE